MNYPVQIDPLDSPHPIPWGWVLANLTETSLAHSGTRYYRSQSLLSPNGQYAAYSRIQMQVNADMLQTQVSSVLFIENLKTGDLQVITASSPLSNNPFAAQREKEMAGKIAMVIPIAWSPNSDRILAREFESVMGSDMASDYAVIWDQQLNRTSTIAPTQIHYTNAILLGWSSQYPGRALFRAGNIGEEFWPLWAVDLGGQTTSAPDDRPLVFGRSLSSIWTGPQASL